MEQILILEDDIALNQGLCKALKTENRKIVSCETKKLQETSSCAAVRLSYYLT